MKRPASAYGKVVNRKRATREVLKRPAAAKKLAGGVRKKPAAPRTPAQPCKPIAEMTRKDFAFFQVPAGRGCFAILRGCKSNRKGFIFEHLDFNRFAEDDSKIPANARRKAVPKEDWLSEFFWDPAKRRLVPDVANLPERAHGKAYRIEDNGGMPWVVYVRNDAVSVFRRPHDGYIWDEDWCGDFDNDRLFYTKEVMTFDSPVNTLIGIDDECKQHGNSILVHASSTKGKCLTATMQSVEPNQSLKVAFTDMAGSQVLSMEVPVDGQVSLLVKKFTDLFHALCVKCVDENGKEVSQDQLLNEYTQLSLQDATQSYVYIGPEIYSFDSVEVVGVYYSIMGNSSVPYPVALTPSKIIFMDDKVEVPREQVASYISNENWGDAYRVFYSHNAALAKTPLANVKELSPREI